MKSFRRHRLTTAVHVSLLLSLPAIAFAQDATTTTTAGQQAKTITEQHVSAHASAAQERNRDPAKCDGYARPLKGRKPLVGET